MRSGVFATCLAGAVVAAAQSASGLSGDDATIYIRRVVDLAQTPQLPELEGVDGFVSNQTANGTWTDVDYASGCDARRLLDRTARAPLIRCREGQLAYTGALAPYHRHPRISHRAQPARNID